MRAPSVPALRELGGNMFKAAIRTAHLDTIAALEKAGKIRVTEYGGLVDMTPGGSQGMTW